MDITSVQNPKVKHIIKLREDKRQRQKDGLIFVEGFDELTLALRCGLHPRTLLTAPELARRPLDIPHPPALTVSRAVFEKLSRRENPDGWLGVFAAPQRSLHDLKLSETPLVVVLESVEKPGNLGAILRTADAAGVDAVLLCDPRVDLWNPNVIRASRGTVFAVPAVETDSPAALSWIRAKKMRALAAVPSAETLYTEADLREPLALLLGAEERGLSNWWIENADLTIKIPMQGLANSLNVSVAAAVIVYESLRQRRQ